LPARAWRPLQRPARSTVQTQPRERPDNVKEAVVVAREFANRRLQSAEVAEFNYTPTACRKTYRMIVIKKTLSVTKGQQVLFDERKSTRLNSSHLGISYAVFCLKKKNKS